jgi:thiol:disulfide interchange protein DsbA
MMQHMLKKTLVLFALLFFFTGTINAEPFEEGIHFKRIDQSNTLASDKVEVLEFFMYGCPHCYSFEPYLNKWEKGKPDDVEFIRVPATFNALSTLHARAYYALQMLDAGEKIHPKFFSEIHNNKNLMRSVDELAVFVQKYGVDRSEFIDAMNSFAVEGNIRKATKLVKEHEINGVPAVTVNGKYLISASMAGSYDNMVKIIDYLIQKETAKAEADLLAVPKS